MKTVPELLAEAAETYAERRKVYGPSEIKFGKVMEALYPGGLNLTEQEDWVRFGILVQIVNKLCRYTASPEGHPDSIHDLGVYAFMLEREDTQK